MTAPFGARLPRRMAMPASGLNGSSNGRDDLAVEARGVLHVLPERAAVHGQRVLVQEPALAERAQHHRQAAGVVEVLHQEPAGGHQVDEAVHAAAEPVEVVERQLDADAPRDREQVHHGVRRAADGARACGSRSRTPRASGSSTARGPRAPSRRCAARPCARGGCAARRRPGWRRSPAGPRRAPRRCDAMVEAVPIVMQWPALRFIAASASWNSSSVISPARSCSLIEMMLVPEPISLAAVDAAQLRAAGDADGGQVGARRAHQQRGRGLVAAHQQHDAVERVRADALLDVHGREVAEQHGGRPHRDLAERG